jgi:hypothetical protein
MGTTAASFTVGTGPVGAGQALMGEAISILVGGEVRGEGAVATEGTDTD